MYFVELTIKIVAIRTVPGNRRPSSSIAGRLLIIVTPILSLVIFFLIGSPFVRGRRAKVQAEANKVISERSAEIPDVPQGADIPVGADSVFRPNRNLNSLPCVTGGSHCDADWRDLEYAEARLAGDRRHVVDEQVGGGANQSAAPAEHGCVGQGD